jgi:hypothetical protein
MTMVQYMIKVVIYFLKLQLKINLDNFTLLIGKILKFISV